MSAVPPPLRAIKSFVIRQGRMTHGQKMALDALADRYCIDPAHMPALPPHTVLEIGFGMGDTLLHYAKANPDVLYLGMEVHPPGIARVLREIENQNLTNIRVIQGDAVQILKSHFPDDSLMRINLFFPDPWPKKKHHKRRIVRFEFASLVAQKLKPQGLFHLATDWEDYAQSMSAVMATHPAYRQVSQDRGDRPLTKFEIRGLRLGHSIFDFCFQRKN